MEVVEREPTEAASASMTEVHRLTTEWLHAGLISPELAEALEAHHRDHHAREATVRNTSRLVAIASSFGAILVGAGILLIVASNSHSMTPLQITVLALAAVVAVEVTGYVVRFRTGFHRTGEAVLFVGAVGYGGTVFLVAQQYNLPPDSNVELFLAWFAPLLPLAYVVGSRWITALGIVLGYVILGMQIATWMGDNATAYAPLMACVLVGAATVAIGGAHRDFRSLRRLAPPWEWLGTVVVLGGLYVAGFRWIERESTTGWIEGVDPEYLVLCVVAAVTAALAVIVRVTRHHGLDREVGFTAAFAGSSLVTAAWFLVAPSTSPVAGFAVANLLMGIAIGTLVVGGVATERASLVNVAFVVFAIVVVSRYLEIGAGMLGTGTAMVLGGVLLIGMGVGLEAFRRRLLRSLGGREVTS